MPYPSNNHHRHSLAASSPVTSPGARLSKLLCDKRLTMPTKKQNETTATETPLDRARAKYESEKRGPDVIRIKLTPSDNVDEWENMKANLIAEHTSIKQGIYNLAKNAGYLTKPRKRPK